MFAEGEKKRGGEEEGASTLGNLDSILAKSGVEEVGEVSAPDPKDAVEEDGFFERKAMSDTQKEKLRREYLAFGGSPNSAMGANYYLYIIVVISALAVAAKLSGAF